MHDTLTKLDSIYKKQTSHNLDTKEYKNLTLLAKASKRDKNLKIIQESTKFYQIRLQEKQNVGTKIDQDIVIDPNSQVEKNYLVNGWRMLEFNSSN